MDDVFYTGYSSRARNPEFLEVVRKVRKKDFKKSLIKMIVYAAILIAALAVLAAAKVTEEMSEALAWATVVAFAATPVFGVITIVRIFITIGTHGKIKSVDKEGCECTVESRQEWETTGHDSNTDSEVVYTNNRLVLRKNDGTAQKYKNDRASCFVSFLKDGDKVFYHPGFPYPLEMYDKSRGNICVFCGKINDAGKRTCEKCEKPMLI